MIARIKCWMGFHKFINWKPWNATHTHMIQISKCENCDETKLRHI